MYSLQAQRTGVYNVYDGVTTLNRFLQHYADLFDPPVPVGHIPLWSPSSPPPSSPFLLE